VRQGKLATVAWRLGALALLICIVIVGTASLGRITISNFRPPIERASRAVVGDLVATARVCQTFVARYDGLSEIRVRLDNRGRESDEPFYFYLRPAPDAAEDIVSLTGSASDVNNNTYYTLEFPSIKDSAGRSYAFCLEAPKAPLDKSITAIGLLDDWYPEGEAVFRDMWGEAGGVQDLDFYLGYRLSLWNTLRVLPKRLAASKPFLCGRWWFYALLGLAYLVLLYKMLVKSILPLDADGH
jgi:hypothetical protein